MEQIKPKFTKKTVILPLVGILSFFVYIYLFNVDLLSILRTAQKAQPLPYLAAILISFVEILFYALSWNELLRGLKVRLALLKAYIFVWYAMFLDILIPAESVSGEICRVYLVNREQCGTSGKVVASLMTYRLLSMVMNSIFLIAGATLLFGVAQINPIVFDAIQILVGTIALFIILLLVVSWKENWSLKIINGLFRLGELVSRGKWKLEKLKQEASNAASLFH